MTEKKKSFKKLAIVHNFLAEQRAIQLQYM